MHSLKPRRRYVEFGSGQQRGTKRKTLRAKVLGGSLGNSTSSLAVFYVEQVALNRHVSPQPQLAPLCLIRRGKSIASAQWSWVNLDFLFRDTISQKSKLNHYPPIA